MWHIQGDSTDEIAQVIDNVSSYGSLWHALLLISAIEYSSEAIPPAMEMSPAGLQIMGEENFFFNTSGADLTSFCDAGWECAPLTLGQRNLWIVSKCLWILVVPASVFGIVINLMLSPFRAIPLHRRRQYLRDNGYNCAHPCLRPTHTHTQEINTH